MNRIFGSHPAVRAFLLGGGAFLSLYFGYKVWSPDTSISLREMDSDLTLTTYWALTGLGILMWLLGGVMFGRNRGMNGFLALLLHLLPVAGLILIAVLRRPLTPHEAWARDNPGLDDTTARRTYRRMKPLY
jgi:hypothetical protein